jgi:uncharacterized protein involved in exopolysaccharide biosynthesis
MAMAMLPFNVETTLAQQPAPKSPEVLAIQQQLRAMDKSINQEIAKVNQLSGSARELELIRLKDMMQRRAALFQSAQQLQSQGGGNANCRVLGKC